MVRTWEDAWAEFIPFLDFAVELRRLVYTTNSILKKQPSMADSANTTFLALRIEGGSEFTTVE